MLETQNWTDLLASSWAWKNTTADLKNVSKLGAPLLLQHPRPSLDPGPARRKRAVAPGYTVSTSKVQGWPLCGKFTLSGKLISSRFKSCLEKSRQWWMRKAALNVSRPPAFSYLSHQLTPSRDIFKRRRWRETNNFVLALWSTNANNESESILVQEELNDTMAKRKIDILVAFCSLEKRII